MDGVVIYVAKDRSRAIVWCSDQGPLGLARRDALPRPPHAPIAVGDLVTFEAIDDGDLRICGRLNPVPGQSMAGLADMLRGDPGGGVQRRRAHLSVVPGRTAAVAGEFTSGPACG